MTIIIVYNNNNYYFYYYYFLRTCFINRQRTRLFTQWLIAPFSHSSSRFISFQWRFSPIFLAPRDYHDLKTECEQLSYLNYILKGVI